MPNEARKYITVKDNLEKLSLLQMALNIDGHIDAVQNGSESFTDAMLSLTDLELKAKEARAMQACVKTANFPFIKTLEDFDFSYQPCVNKQQLYGFRDLRFIENKENILFIGNPGVGKTHLSVSIGIEAAMNRQITYFISCNDLIMNLKRALLENRLDARLKQYAKYKVLILDELGYLPMDDIASKLFFQLIAKRYERNSTIITTNKPVSEWAEIFGDPVLANAIVDRLLHHSHVIKITGRSYRTKNVINDPEEE